MPKFADFVEKNTEIGPFNPHPAVKVDGVSGNYMVGSMGDKEFEVFVHRIPMGRGIMNGRVYKLAIKAPKIDHASPGEPGWSQEYLAQYDRGWIVRPVTPECDEAVRSIVAMFPGEGTPRTEMPDTVPRGSGEENERVESDGMAERDEYWKNKLYGEAKKEEWTKEKDYKKLLSLKRKGLSDKEIEGVVGKKKKDNPCPMMDDDDWAKKLYGEDYAEKLEEAKDEWKSLGKDDYEILDKKGRRRGRVYKVNGGWTFEGATKIKAGSEFKKPAPTKEKAWELAQKYYK